MSDVFKFPKGYEVKILRKEDVLASIDANIIDKDVALEIVKKCEIDAANFLREGCWASIPFIGNLRVPKTTKKLLSEETQAILGEAKTALDRDKFLLFRKSIAFDIGKQVKVERYYRYTVSKFVGKNPKFFKDMSAKYGDIAARFLCYTLCDLSMIETESEQYE